jgi:AAA domain/DnaB-like helicase N terminal domain
MERGARRQGRQTIAPHDLDAERAVLGVVLLEGVDAWARGAATLAAEDFYEDRHRAIYQAMADLASLGKPLDTLTVTAVLRERGDLERAGGPAHLALLLEEASIAVYLPSYIEIIRQLRTKRHILQECRQVVLTAEQNGPLDALVAKLASLSASVTDRQDPADRPHGVVRRLVDVVPEEVSWLWPGRLALGKLTVLMGDAGLGKSFIALDLAARLSTGRQWPDGHPGAHAPVVLLTAEDGIADTVRPRVDVLQGDASLIHVLEAVRKNDVARPFCLQSDLAVLQETVQGTGARLVVIDPLSAYLGDVDSFKDTAVRSVLAPLVALADKVQVAIVAIVHLTKNRDRAAIHRALGSVAFTAAARVVLAVAKDPKDEHGERRLLLSVKNNLARMPPTLAFSMDQETGVAWEPDPVADIDADAVLAGARADSGHRGGRQEAIAFLERMLADGEVAVDSLNGAARDAGIAQRTLDRARKDMGLRPHRHGRGGWYLVKDANSCRVAIFGADPGEELDTTKRSSKSANASYDVGGPGGALPLGEVVDPWEAS